MFLVSFVVIIAIIIIFVFIIWVYCKLSCGVCRSSTRLVGKTVIITGGNAGIGFETAKDLAERGARVILACRNEGRGTAARDQIRAATGSSEVHYRHLDLASLNSVREFADNILRTEKRLDVLVNNAGCFGSKFENTEDGLLLEMQSNHFGPFLLTNLLLPLLKSSAPSRIVNVSSVGHKRGVIDFNNLNCEKETKKTYGKFKVYCTTKLCNILMTMELDRQLKGTGVTVNALHPGIIATGISGHDKLMTMPVFFLKPFCKTPWQGAQTTIHLAVAPELMATSGRYFKDCEEANVTKETRDVELARRLWEESEKLVKLKAT